MKSKVYYLLCFMFLISLFSFRGYEKEKSAEAVWFDIVHPQKKINYYIEADLNGKVLMREILDNKIVVRRGIIKKMYVKDFIREVKNSEIISEQNEKDSKMMFYKGEMINLSAYINGELKRISSPMYRFSEAFKFAFSELKKQILNIKPDKMPPSAFIRAVPLTGENLDNFNKRISSGYELKTIETKILRQNMHIFKAINEPYRIFPVDTDEDVIKISDYISENKLFGMKSLFYIGTTRGNFECSVFDAK